MGQRWLDGYSAEVEIYLLIAGKRHDVSQIIDDTLILRDQQSISPGTRAMLVIKVDGHEEREQIRLLAGAESNHELIPFS